MLQGCNSYVIQEGGAAVAFCHNCLELVAVYLFISSVSLTRFRVFVLLTVGDTGPYLPDRRDIIFFQVFRMRWTDGWPLNGPQFVSL